MSETGFTCPKCGNTKSFRANGKVEHCEVRIDEDSWDDGRWFNGVELPAWALIECVDCNYEAPWWEFDEWYAKFQDGKTAAYVHGPLETCIGPAVPNLFGLFYKENWTVSPETESEQKCYAQAVRVTFDDYTERVVDISGLSLQGVLEAVVSEIGKDAHHLVQSGV